MEEQERVCNLIHKFLKLNNICIGHDRLKLELYGNPDYPKLFSILQALASLNVPFSAYETDNKKEDFKNLPDSFLALVLDYHGAHRIALIKRSKDGILVEFEKKIKQNVTEEVFVEFWSGIAITIENKESSLVYYYKSIFGNRNILLLLLFIGLISGHLGNNPTLLNSVHFILSLSGFFIGILIFMVEINLSTTMTEKICAKSNKTFNCTDLITSKSALLFNSFKLGDAVVVYFSILVLSNLLFGNNPMHIYTLSFTLGMLSIPAIFYSVFLQLKTSKSCILCLAVLVVLSLQLILVSLFFFEDLVFSTGFTLKILLVSITLFFLWKVTRNIIEENRNGFSLSMKYIKLKRNYKIFEFLLDSNPSIITYIGNSNEIIFGNKNATVELIFVTNPNCQFCKMAYETIHNIIENYGEYVRVVFRIGSLENDASELQIANDLIRIYNEEGEKECYDELKQLFQKDNRIKLKESGGSTDLGYKYILDLQGQWAKANALDYVPVLIVNQRLYPSEHYEIEDLSFFMDNLIQID